YQSSVYYPETMNTVIVENCVIDSIVGDTTSNSNSASIMIQVSNNVSAINNIINVKTDERAQIDGFYISEIFESGIIKNNKVTLENNIQVIDSQQPHIDCIQLVKVKDFIIENNYLRNNSISINYNKRSGVIASGILDNIKIRNNVIISAKGNNLINVHFDNNSDSVLIHNNTLVGLGNQELLAHLENDTLFSGVLNLTNNIFYKYVTNTNKTLVKIMKLTITSAMLDNNIYHNTNSNDTLVIQQNSTYLSWRNFDPQGSNLNPNLDSNNTYITNPESPAKNKGKYLPDLNVDFNDNKRPHWDRESFDIGAFELPDAQIKIGVINGTQGNDIVHKIAKIHKLFIWDTITFTISNDNTLENVYYVSKIDSPSQSDSMIYWKGFTYKWIYQPDADTSYKPIGIGFFKINNSDDANSYFYLDCRSWYDNNFNPNIYLRYNAAQNVKIYQYFKNNSWNDITNGSIIYIWDIRGETSITTSFPNFWNNMLAGINHLSHPLIAWSNYPSEDYSIDAFNVYRKYESANFQLLANISSDVFHYYDTTVYLSTPDTNHSIKYFITADLTPVYARGGVTESENSDTTIFYSSLNKKGDNLYNKLSYQLSQNYPNPFNPSTKINFSLKESGLVTLKIYNLLGEEIITLINSEISEGEHTIAFDASNFSSGIYFYTIKINNYSKTLKMMVIK
ncbi:MAG TPA: T9SS type A sorting domain-containing protein, partial [Nitrososphaeraceae archaeon]|nr:T9SS type A sorting domain-containing protein [Nitrososphaeraceae archaeon]